MYKDNTIFYVLDTESNGYFDGFIDAKPFDICLSVLQLQNNSLIQLERIAVFVYDVADRENNKPRMKYSVNTRNHTALQYLQACNNPKSEYQKMNYNDTCDLLTMIFETYGRGIITVFNHKYYNPNKCDIKTFSNSQDNFSSFYFPDFPILDLCTEFYKYYQLQTIQPTDKNGDINYKQETIFNTVFNTQIKQKHNALFDVKMLSCLLQAYLSL